MKQIPAFILLLAIGLRLPAQRLTQNAAFGNGGTTLFNLYDHTNDDYIATDINLTDKGQIQVSGHTTSSGSGLYTMGANGRYDPGFGHKGFAFYDFGHNGMATSIILKAPGGRTLLIGYNAPCNSIGDADWTDEGAAVIRLLPDGSQDPSFGINGKAFIIWPYIDLQGCSGLVQPDGKILIAGRGSWQGDFDVFMNRLFITRLTANGKVDSSFGINGICSIPQFQGDDHTENFGRSAIALQPDGRIVLGDVATEQVWVNLGVATDASAAVYRVTANGIMDSTFGVNGMFFNHFGFPSYVINGLLCQQDGRIVVSTSVGGNNSFNLSGSMLFRLDSAGKKLDSSFGTNGLYLGTADTSRLAPAWKTFGAGSIVAGPNGSITVSAIHNTATNGWLDIFRLTSAGRLDTTFAKSTAGRYSVPVRNNHFLAGSRIVVDSAGNLTALGTSGYMSIYNSPDPMNFIVARVTRDGTPVKTFNATGIVEVDFNQDTATQTQFAIGSSDYLTGMTRLPNGRILLTGYSWITNDSLRQSFIAALTPTGQRDNSFGVNGWMKTVNANWTLPGILCPLENNEAIACKDDQTLYKVGLTGKIDSSWGQNGLVTLSNAPSQTQVQAIMEQPDKKLLVLYRSQLRRLNPDGSPDIGFGNQGILTFNSYFPVDSRAIRLQPDGKIVVAMHLVAMKQQLYLFRCNADGTPDNAFGVDGDGFAQVEVDIPAAYELPFSNTFADFQLLPDGKFIVLALKERNYGIGYAPQGATWPDLYKKVVATNAHFRDFIVFRMTTDGKIDSSFGGIPDPQVYKGCAHLFLPYVESLPTSINIDPNTGNLLLSGLFNRGTGWDAGFVTLRANGHYDTTCTVAGTATLGIDNMPYFSDPDIFTPPLFTLPLPDGSYLVAGTQQGQSTDVFIKDVLPPSAPAAGFTNLQVAPDTACLRADLSWQTTFECGVDSFIVEHSQDGTNFTRLGAVRAAGGGSYTLAAAVAGYGPNYYRIRSATGDSLYGGSDPQGLFIDSNAVAKFVWNNVMEEQQDSLFNITLNWKTTAEDGATSFQLQQGPDSTHFTTIATITPDDVASGSTYSATVNHLSPGKYYYRVLATGTECRSAAGPALFVPLVLKKDSCPDLFLAWPNPVHSELTVQIPACKPGDLYITDMWGRVLKIIHDPSPKLIINFAPYNPGFYFLRFISNDTRTIKVLKI